MFLNFKTVDDTDIAINATQVLSAIASEDMVVLKFGNGERVSVKGTLLQVFNQLNNARLS